MKTIRTNLRSAAPILLTFSLLYWEILNNSYLYGRLGFNNLYPIAVALLGGSLLSLAIFYFPRKIRRGFFFLLLTLLSTLYFGYFLYHKIFQVPFSLISLQGAQDAMQFTSLAVETAIRYLGASVSYFLLPVFALLLSVNFDANNKKHKRLVLAIAIISLILTSLIRLDILPSSTLTHKLIKGEIIDADLNLKQLGLITSIELDFRRNILKKTPELAQPFIEEPNPEEIAIIEEPAGIADKYNYMSIDFQEASLAKNDPEYQKLDLYFSLLQPDEKNEYTGMFKDHNLILITAESFHSIAIDPDLTPTLYMMMTEGFHFKNFYNPIWGVSTLDGEYVATTGLIPKTGVWSLTESGDNNMMYTMGNQLRPLGYYTIAFHNHTYTYYKRQISHPNMGYEYYGIGNGLKISSGWPRSDLEMIEASVPQYIDKTPFHCYYMSVSGHMQYTFSGNLMSAKNKKHTDDLPYSSAIRAYLACNLELEFAMERLIELLEEKGLAENTVIVISPDHYPYGLTLEEINERTPEPVTERFEILRSTLIIWKKGMEPVTVDKYCSSLDIIPTVSNLFGLDYDSRLLIGHDILSPTDGLVMFKDQSWLTDKGVYDIALGKLTPWQGVVMDSDEQAEYVKRIKKEVRNKFHYSAKILDLDYYDYLAPYMSKPEF